MSVLVQRRARHRSRPVTPARKRTIARAQRTYLGRLRAMAREALDYVAWCDVADEAPCDCGTCSACRMRRHLDPRLLRRRIAGLLHGVR